MSAAADTTGQVSVELRDIVQEYPNRDGAGVARIIDGISMKFDRPGIVVLLGPSGCGKSTLLHMMGGVRPIGVQTPTAGEVLIDGVPCHDAHPDAVMVFQRYANRPDLSVVDNIAFPFRLKIWRDRVATKEWRERVEQTVEAVGLADHRRHTPAQLSGGQNQRVALARALVLRPRILLMDEPFGALDAQTRVDMQTLLVKLHGQQPCLIVFVTHDVTEALVLSDRVLVLSTQPARIADDFAVLEPRPRGADWLRSPEAAQLEERVLRHLRARSDGAGQLRVSI